MTTERFNKLVEEIREASLDTLVQKNANYATDKDRLHNFKVGAAITGGTPAQAALGYMAKHLASLQDKVARNNFHDREDLKEKIQDSINYLVFIWCCANEEMEKDCKSMSDTSGIVTSQDPAPQEKYTDSTMTTGQSRFYYAWNPLTGKDDKLEAKATETHEGGAQP